MPQIWFRMWAESGCNCHGISSCFALGLLSILLVAIYYPSLIDCKSVSLPIWVYKRKEAEKNRSYDITLWALDEKLGWAVVKNKAVRHGVMSSAPCFSILKWIREWKECDVERLVEWKERTSKWWKREGSWTVALANVFPGCSHSKQTPGPLMLSLTDHRKEKKKGEKWGAIIGFQQEAAISLW